MTATTGTTGARTNRRRTFSLLAGLYVSQYLGIGFFYIALSAILRERGMPLEQIALIQLPGLFWAAKFLWAPLVDRYGSRTRGHYRSWLLVLQPLLVVALLAMIPIDPVADFGTLLLPLAAVVALFSATQDIASDALAVRALDVADRGTGNGIQFAGGFLGRNLGGGGVLIVYDVAGWGAALFTLAVLTALPILLVVRYPEPARDPDLPRAGFRAIVTVFREPGVARWALLIMPLLWTGIGATYGLITPMLVDTGWSLAAIGVLTVVVAGGFAVVGAAGGGVLVRRYGRHRTLLGFGAGQVLMVLALLPLAAGSRETVLVAVALCLFNVAYAAASTVIYTINMDLSRHATAGTDYPVLSSFAFICALVSGVGGLAVAGQVGYVPVVVGSAALIVVALLAAALVFVDRADGSPSARVDGRPRPAGATGRLTGTGR